MEQVNYSIHFFKKKRGDNNMDEEKNNFHGIVLVFSIIFLMILLTMNSYVLSTYLGSVSFDVSVVNAVKKEPLTEEYTSLDTLKKKLKTVGYIYYMKDLNDDVIARADIDYRNSSAFIGGHELIRIKWNKKGLKSISKDTLEAVYNFKDLKPSFIAKFILAGDISTDKYKIYGIRADACADNSILGKIFSLGSNKRRVWVAFPRSKEELEQHYPIDAKLSYSNVIPVNKLSVVSVDALSYFPIIKYEWSKDGLVSTVGDGMSAIYLFKTTGSKTISVTLYNEVGMKKTLTATINVVDKDKK